jgi:hypothetical protein
LDGEWTGHKGWSSHINTSETRICLGKRVRKRRSSADGGISVVEGSVSIEEDPRDWATRWLMDILVMFTFW